jgi:hypothetical protein
MQAAKDAIPDAPTEAKPRQKLSERIGLDPDKVRAKYKEAENAAASTEAEQPGNDAPEEKPAPAQEPPKMRGTLTERLKNRTPNAPEVDKGGDPTPLVEMSKQTLTEDGVFDKQTALDLSTEKAAAEQEKAPPLTADDILDRLQPGKILKLSTKRANNVEEYVQTKTLDSLVAVNKITYYKVGQLAYIEVPDTTSEDVRLWTQVYCAALPLAGVEVAESVANAWLTAKRKVFGAQ